MRVRIGLIDNEPLYLFGLNKLIDSLNGYEVVFTSEKHDQIKDLARSHLPDIITVNIFNQVNTLLEQIRWIRDQQPNTKIIILTTVYDHGKILSVVRNGANAVLSKTCDQKELLVAFTEVVKTGYYVNDLYKRGLHHSLSGNPNYINELSFALSLSKRELDVLRLICAGMNNEEIAQKLSLSANTIAGHRNNILSKTCMKNTAGLVMFAVRNGLVDLY